MRGFILVFVFFFMGTVLAENIALQAEGTTSIGHSSEKGFYLGSIFIVGGVLFLLLLLLNLYFPSGSTKAKRAFFSLGSLKKYVFSLLRPKKKTDFNILSQSHYVKMQERADDEQELLQKKNDEFMRLKEDILHEFPKVLDQDVKRVLKITDDLLAKIPSDKADAFVHSADFELYKKVMKKVHEPLHESKEELERVSKILDLFEKGVIDSDEVRKLLGLPVRHLHVMKVEKKDKREVLQELKKVRYEKN